jgi:hypothetical protein
VKTGYLATISMGNYNVKKIKELATVLLDYLQKVEAQMPTHKKTGLQISLPINSLKFEI